MKSAFSIFAVLIVVVGSAFGQTVTEIETRGKEPTYPDYYKVTGGSEGG